MSVNLQNVISKMIAEGKHFTDESKSSEKTLKKVLNKYIKPYLDEYCSNNKGKLIHKSEMSQYELQLFFHEIGGPFPSETSKKIKIRPDGGIFLMKKNEKMIPLLVIEDKIQGTNDIRCSRGLGRQATGNAVERAFKNVRAAEMLFCKYNFFPYIIFCSGCDFHSTETIADRLVIANLGYPNHKIEINSKTTDLLINERIDEIKRSIDIDKKHGKSVITCFIKSHKWDDMPHGSSSWDEKELLMLCKEVCDKVFKHLDLFINQI